MELNVADGAIAELYGKIAGIVCFFELTIARVVNGVEYIYLKRN